MFNLFKNAVFGNRFRTRDGMKVIYWFMFDDNGINKHVLITNSPKKIYNDQDYQASEPKKSISESYVIYDNWGREISGVNHQYDIISLWDE